jgi:transcriptional regulator GlxA family with amidase domain
MLKHDTSQAKLDEPHHVLIVAFDGVTLIDIVGPADVINLASRYALPTRSKSYKLTFASIHGGQITASNGIAINTVSLAEVNLTGIGTIIVPGSGPPEDPPIPTDLVLWIKDHGSLPDRICGVCTGVFLLAAAGLLDGKTVTTHWEAVDVLRQRYPSLRVTVDAIFVRDGRFWSSAGFSTGIDLALALIAEDHGHDIALRVAKSLVVFMKRSSEQPQISAPLKLQELSNNRFSTLHAWIASNIDRNITVGILADLVGMSVRTFSRTYQRQAGHTPARTVEMFRLNAAQDLIKNSTLPMKQIARNTGFGDEQNLRRALERRHGIGPQRLRELGRN